MKPEDGTQRSRFTWSFPSTDHQPSKEPPVIPGALFVAGRLPRGAVLESIEIDHDGKLYSSWTVNVTLH